MENRFSYIFDIAMLLEGGQIETSRVFIRRFKESDIDDFCEYVTSKKLCHDLGWPNMETRELAEDYFRNLNLVTGSIFAIVHKESGKVIGNIGIGLWRELLRNPILNHMRGITLSFALSEKYHNQGIMSELLKYTCHCLFAQDLVDYINCGYFHFNEASKRVQEKVGFQYYTEHYLQINDEELLTIENLLFRSMCS